MHASKALLMPKFLFFKNLLWCIANHALPLWTSLSRQNFSQQEPLLAAQIYDSQLVQDLWVSMCDRYAGEYNY